MALIRVIELAPLPYGKKPRRCIDEMAKFWNMDGSVAGGGRSAPS